MQEIKYIKEERKVFLYLQKRNLINQYKKAKNYILAWDLQNVDFKLRKPKKDKIYYFKINNQYRAFASLFEDTLVIFEIYNHQN